MILQRIRIFVGDCGFGETKLQDRGEKLSFQAKGWELSYMLEGGKLSYMLGGGKLSFRLEGVNRLFNSYLL